MKVIALAQRGVWSATLLLTTTSVWSQGALSLRESEKIGQELAAELREARPGGSSTNTGTLRQRDGRGNRRPVPVRVITSLTAAGWSLTYQTYPTNGLAETLLVRYGAGRPIYEWTRGTNAPKRLAPSETGVPFAGSDFWICDLGLEFLQWPTQRYVSDELSNGRTCKVLESVNPHTNGYARVRSYIDAEFKGLLSAEAFDLRGLLVKTFSTGSFTKINDRWFLRDIRIRDERTDTRTELQYTLPEGQ